MNTTNAQLRAKKRLKGIFSLSTREENDINNQVKTEDNKEYTLAVHDKSKYEVKIKKIKIKN